MSADRFIACGMYAFTEAQQQAWQTLFDCFEPPPVPGLTVQKALDFRHGDTVLRDPSLFFGHTCGYPLMTQLLGAFTPFCTARFDVPGTEGKRYSSQMIVNADSDIDSLHACEGGVIAINNVDSNSGMNALRYELARIGAKPGFFSNIVMTGGHLHSLEAVADNKAQLAAIDCVTFQLIVDARPELAARVRSIGITAKTCGLPFVLPGDNPPADLKSGCTDALNRAFDKLPVESRQCLHLAGFEAVDYADYESILELERFALNQGFNLIN